IAEARQQQPAQPRPAGTYGLPVRTRTRRPGSNNLPSPDLPVRTACRSYGQPVRTMYVRDRGGQAATTCPAPTCRYVRPAGTYDNAEARQQQPAQPRPAGTYGLPVVRSAGTYDVRTRSRRPGSNNLPSPDLPVRTACRYVR